MATLARREGWKCVLVESGEVFVEMAGTRQMLTPSANSWTWEKEVRMAAFGHQEDPTISLALACFSVLIIQNQPCTQIQSLEREKVQLYYPV